MQVFMSDPGNDIDLETLQMLNDVVRNAYEYAYIP